MFHPWYIRYKMVGIKIARQSFVSKHSIQSVILCCNFWMPWHTSFLLVCNYIFIIYRSRSSVKFKVKVTGSQMLNKAFIVIRLRPGIPTPVAPYGQTWRHPQIRKYITYHNIAGRGLSHSHRRYAHKILWWLVLRFQRYDRRQTHTDRQTDWSQYSAPLLGRSNERKQTETVSGWSEAQCCSWWR